MVMSQCSPVGAEKLCGGGSKLELVRAHRGMGFWRHEEGWC